ncbi:MAG: hypothetical protein GXO82_08200 [Chlorobi bacterium]|nr:hypothetical protein [Chlorobiota bacterium]
MIRCKIFARQPRSILFFLMISIVLAHAPAVAQNFNTKALLEDYSREIFETNAAGFMGPLVIVANVGANDALYNSAYVPAANDFYVRLSVRTMFAGVLESERTYTAHLPLEQKNNPHPVGSAEWWRITQLNLFKLSLSQAAQDGALETDVETATVFGGEGSGFVVPKDWMRENISYIDSATLAGLPSELTLTNGTNQNMVFAAVPQITVGSLYNTELDLRFVPPVVFDPNVGKFSFYGVGLTHAFTNWFHDPPFDAAVQVAFQRSQIKNEVGVTKAKLEARTNLFTVNLHASKRWGWAEPYAGISYETLDSDASYTFTLPQSIKDEIGYDIDPQTVPVSLSDQAIKATLGFTAHVGPLMAFVSAGFAKHMIYSGGIGYRFE